MKFRRKPVERAIVDAIKLQNEETYIVQHASGATTQESAADFERDYEPIKRDRTKPAKPSKRKAKHSATAEVVPS